MIKAQARTFIYIEVELPGGPYSHRIQVQAWDDDGVALVHHGGQQLVRADQLSERLHADASRTAPVVHRPF